MCQETGNKGEIVIYQTPDGTIELGSSTVKEYLTVQRERQRSVRRQVAYYNLDNIRNIFAESELQESVVCANFVHTTQHGAIKGKTQT
ncbi:MAG: hypothetical protein LBQ78_04030 [Tannerellaceae bacterium]|jgi:hypothetical protein|nr:hypothetical protein [Tannerellaceae bacterium]